ncbi:MAG: T9SS type A sorting domain-containing protein [Chitinophagaceae bacterium]
MKQIYTTLFVALTTIVGVIKSQAQSGVVATGETTETSGAGSISNSVGQIDFEETTTTSNTVTYGLQQNYNTTSALPVTLLDFTATKYNSTALLSWSTASEISNAGFYLERSLDGKTWGTSIGYVASKAPNGNSSTQLDYNYTDATPLSGINYYRLKQTDLDGKYAYSVTRTVTFDGQDAIGVYPNPTTDVLHIRNVVAGQQVRIVGMDGKVYRTLTVTTSPQQVSVSGLAAGVYFAQLLQNGTVIGTVKFMKQ